MATKITKSELKQMIREALREELDKKKLHEAGSSRKAYLAMMDVQRYIMDTLGWDIYDCQQDDAYSMMLRCTGNKDDTDSVAALEDFAANCGLEVFIEGRSAADFRVYLEY